MSGILREFLDHRCPYEKTPHRGRNLLPALKEFALTDDDFKGLCFDESLLIVDGLRHEVGALRVDLAKTGDVASVNIRAEHVQSGYEFSMSASSFVDRRFNTLAERRYESRRSVGDNMTLGQTLFLGRIRSGYRRRHAVEINGRPCYERQTDITEEAILGFVSETAHVLLARKLASKSFSGEFNARLFSICGEPGIASYKVYCPKYFLVSGKRLSITKLRRKIFFENGYNVTAYAYLTQLGQLIKMRWSDTLYTVVINPRANISTTQVIPPERSIPFDVTQGVTKIYFDNEVRKNMFLFKSYLADHPEVKDILYDFLNSLLIYRPAGVLSYAITFFRDTL